MSVRMNFTDNTKLAIKAIDNASKDTLLKIASVVMPTIYKNTPVDTGYLRSQNGFKITGLPFFKRKLVFYNNCNYAIFVHEGTRKMRARRFIKNSILEQRTLIIQIALSTYRRGLFRR